MDLVAQQNATIDSQRNQLAQQNAQLEAQRRQIEDLQRQLAAKNHQLSMQGGNAGALADQLRAAQEALTRAQEEAARYKRELESCRDSQRRLQGENEALRERTRKLEDALQQLQNDCLRQKQAAEAEIDRLLDELAEAKKQAELGSLKKELQMREMMANELAKCREDCRRDIDKLRKENSALKDQVRDCKDRLEMCENPCARPSPCGAAQCMPARTVPARTVTYAAPPPTQSPARSSCNVCTPPPGYY